MIQINCSAKKMRKWTERRAINFALDENGAIWRKNSKNYGNGDIAPILFHFQRDGKAYKAIASARVKIDEQIVTLNYAFDNSYHEHIIEDGGK